MARSLVEKNNNSGSEDLHFISIEIYMTYMFLHTVASADVVMTSDEATEW